MHFKAWQPQQLSWATMLLTDRTMAKTKNPLPMSYFLNVSPKRWHTKTKMERGNSLRIMGVLSWHFIYVSGHDGCARGEDRFISWHAAQLIFPENHCIFCLD